MPAVPSRWLLSLTFAASTIAAVLMHTGCSRDHYYRQADRDAYSLVAEKSTDPRWAAPGFSVEVDPRSRYFDPCDPVCPPMPPDDPAAHRYMHRVDGKRGWPCWHAFGDRRELENPQWLGRLPEYVELTPGGQVVLNIESALRLAYVNAPDYQSQLETIYLSALDVSAERFRFDVQFFGAYNTTYANSGPLHRNGPRSDLSVRSGLPGNVAFRLDRNFATAGELLVGFANSFVWQFAGPDQYTAASLLNFSLVQPLLRGAGRDVILEQLTIAERNLLANLRAMQRYQQGFYTRIATGSSGVTGPQRRGGFFGGTGLTGFTGTGSGGFGGVGAATGFGRAGFGGGGGAGGGGGGAGFAGGGAGQVGGFIGLLQQLQQIRNTEESLNLQLRTLRLLEAHLEAGTIDLTQVDQFRQSIETERANLLQSENGLQDGLDSYKTGNLGMPPDLPVVLDDGFVRQFQLIDPGMSELQSRLAGFMETFGQQPAEPELQSVRAALDTVAELRQQSAVQFDEVRTDLDRFQQHVQTHHQTLDAQRAQQLPQEIERLAAALEELDGRFAGTQQPLKQLGDALAEDTRAETADRLVELMTELAAIVDELSLVQARARLEMVDVRPLELTSEEALEMARFNRLDWMNNRAALVDTWRLIAFNADALQSTLDVTVSGEVGTVGNNPVAFSSPTGQMQVGLRFDAPFTRLLERNNFRQVLIDYQRDRRQLIQYEDGVHQTLRGLLRRLDQLAVNLEIQRRAVAIAIRRVDETRDVLSEPPPPTQPGQPAAQLGPTAALNLLTALSDLRSSQDNFMSVWLNYYAARMQLMRELGVMMIDDSGAWIDQPLSQSDLPPAEEPPLPPPVPGGLLEHLGPDPPQDQPTPDRPPPPQMPPMPPS